MKNDIKAKKRIFEATLKLLETNKFSSEITVRQIAVQACVNVALINYYYHSKENLLQLVVQHKMSDFVNELHSESLKEHKPIDRLKKFLITTAKLGFDNYEINRIASDGEMRNGCINSCNMIIPILEMIFGNTNKELNRIRAMQLMVLFHNIMLYPKIYNEYFDTDFFDNKKRAEAITKIVDFFLEGVC